MLSLKSVLTLVKSNSGNRTHLNKSRLNTGLITPQNSSVNTTEILYSYDTSQYDADNDDDNDAGGYDALFDSEDIDCINESLEFAKKPSLQSTNVSSDGYCLGLNRLSLSNCSVSGSSNNGTPATTAVAVRKESLSEESGGDNTIFLNYDIYQNLDILAMHPNFSKSAVHSATATQSQSSASMLLESCLSIDLTEDEQMKPSIKDLDVSTLVHISTFMDRFDHFTQLSQICKSMNDIFSLKSYFDSSQPLNTELFECDLKWFESNVKPLFEGNGDDADNKKSNFELIIPSFDQSNPLFFKKLKFYLTYYDSFIVLQNKYFCGRNRSSFSLSKNQSPSQQTKLSYRFPTVFKSVKFQSQLNIGEIRWISDIWKDMSSKSPLSQWIFDNCVLSNYDINLLTNALSQRKHYSTIEYLSFVDNCDISDGCIPPFLNAIAEHCPKILQLDLTGTGIGNRTCEAVAEFYRRCVYVNGMKPTNIIWKKTNVNTKGEQKFCELAAFSPSDLALMEESQICEPTPVAPTNDTSSSPQ